MTTPVSDELIRDAYVYLLGRYLVVRQEHTDRATAEFAYNRITYNPLGSADFVNPNLDVAYLEAWIAVDEQTAVVLTVPEITDRYYTAQLLDEWGEVIANINERATPSTPHGRFALAAPGTSPTIPGDAVRLDLHGRKAKLLARVELKGEPDAAVDLQHGFRLEPLGDVQIEAPPDIKEFDNTNLLGVEIFEHAEAVLASALDAYWSIILVSVPDYRVVPNALERYNLNQYSSLQFDADGALTIAIQPERPDDSLVSNWLPSPMGAPFSLTLRCYVPRDVAPLGRWTPPAVTRAE